MRGNQYMTCIKGKILVNGRCWRMDSWSRRTADILVFLRIAWTDERPSYHISWCSCGCQRIQRKNSLSPVSTIFSTSLEEDFESCFWMWQDLWDKYVSSEGKDFQGNSWHVFYCNRFLNLSIHCTLRPALVPSASTHRSFLGRQVQRQEVGWQLPGQRDKQSGQLLFHD